MNDVLLPCLLVDWHQQRMVGSPNRLEMFLWEPFRARNDLNGRGATCGVTCCGTFRKVGLLR